MSVNNIASAAATSKEGGAAKPITNPKGVLGQNDFLKLMIAQLQARTRSDPSNANEYVKRARPAHPG